MKVVLKEMRLRFGALLLLCFLSLHAGAQSTIGSGEAPEKGALLQLKDKTGVTDGSENATRGVGLPRVQLKDATGDLATTMGATAGSYDNKTHKGLVVYVPEQFPENDPQYCPGVYLWDGSRWAPLFGGCVIFIVGPGDWD